MKSKPKKSFHVIQNIKLERTDEKRPILIDVFLPLHIKTDQQVVVFSHGFKGFKDWGHFNLIAKKFATRGFVFVKFNFSMNGGTVEQPVDFPDLEAFGNNNYTTELNDLKDVVRWIGTLDFPAKLVSPKISLVGHSRGGGITLLAGSQISGLNKVCTWASVSDFSTRFPDIDTWRSQQVWYVTNSRTQQEMPLYFQFYKDFETNKSMLDIPSCLTNYPCPLLVVHGSSDEAVNVKDAEFIHAHAKGSVLKIIDNAGHTFGGKHPWVESKLPKHTEELTDITIGFLNQ